MVLESSVEMLVVELVLLEIDANMFTLISLFPAATWLMSIGLHERAPDPNCMLIRLSKLDELQTSVLFEMQDCLAKVCTVAA